MRKILSILGILSLAILAGCGNITQTSKESGESATPQISTEKTITTTQDDNQTNLESACKDSGGSFSEGKCACPGGTYEFDGKDVPLYTYEEETGYCIDAMGLPGGKLGEDEKAKHPLSVGSN